MSPLAIVSGVIDMLCGLAFIIVASYGLGRLHGSPVYTINGGLPPATDWGQVQAVQEIELTAEVVGYLEPVTAQITLPPFAVLPELPAPLELSAAQIAVDEHDELVAQVTSLQRSKASALARARVATARVAGLVDAALRPRRLPKAVLVEATIEVDQREVLLVPAPIAKKLEADS